MTFCYLPDFPALRTHFIRGAVRRIEIPGVLTGCRNFTVAVRRSDPAAGAFGLIVSCFAAGRLLCRYLSVIVTELCDRLGLGLFADRAGVLFRSVGGTRRVGGARQGPVMVSGRRNLTVTGRRPDPATGTLGLKCTCCTAGRLLRRHLLEIMTELCDRLLLGLLANRTSVKLVAVGRTCRIGGAGVYPGVVSCCRNCSVPVRGTDSATGTFSLIRAAHTTVRLLRCHRLVIVTECILAYSTADSTFLRRRTRRCRTIPGMISGCGNCSVAGRRTDPAAGTLGLICTARTAGGLLRRYLLEIVAELRDAFRLGLLADRTGVLSRAVGSTRRIRCTC